MKPLETQAETALAAAYGAARGEATGRERDARDRAFDIFRARGLPSRRVEAWHYTDLRASMTDSYAAARPEIVATVAGGRDWPAGLRVRQLRDVFVGGGSDGDVASLFGDQGSDDSTIALNAAMARDGIVIDVAPGAVIPSPVELAFPAVDGDPRAEFSRCLIRVGAGAALVVVERHASRARVQRHSALVFEIGEGARVEHVFLAESDQAEIHIATLIAAMDAGARFASTALVADCGALRRQCFARLRGEGAKAAFHGVSLLSGKRRADTTLVVDHAAPRCQSRELFKHIVDGEATGVFQGKVIVRPGAQKADGGMKSQALLLSDDAAMYNKPELEIFADDVVCGHGATVGQIDADQLFYLMARGLPRANAEALLIEGFAREAIEHVGDDAVRGMLEASLARWLERRAS